MQRSPRERNAARPATLIAVVAVVAVLYFASPVLIPLALSLLACFLLGPLVRRIERLRVPRVLAVLIVAVGVTLGLAAVGRMVLVQSVDLAKQLPQYRENLREKLRSLRPGQMSLVLESARELSRELTGASEEVQSGDQPSTTTTSPNEPEPVPVRVAPEEIGVPDILTSGLGVLATLGITIVLVIFMLIERESLRDRIVHLLGRSRLYVTTVAFDEAARRISRVLLTQFFINVVYGVAVGVGLWIVGVPNAALWGLLGIVLRFIPYAGAWFVAAGPILLSLAVFDDWQRPLLVISLFLVVELIVNNVLEPKLFGASMGVSSLAVLISVLFWTWLWGPAGLILALPMTVCVVVAGQHVPQLRFVSVLLSDDPAVEAHARMYQRLLAMDTDEPAKFADEYLKDHELVEFFDRVLLPTLVLAERDRHAGALDETRAKFVIKTVAELIERAVTTPEGANPPPAVVRKALCVAAHDDADALAARMLEPLLTRRGFQVATMPASALASEVIEQIRQTTPDIVWISAVPPNAAWHSHYLCRRLALAGLETHLVIALWHTKLHERTTQRLRRCGAKRVVRSIQEAVEASA